MRLLRYAYLLALILLCTACGDGSTSVSTLRSAFFGLDDALPPAIEGICPGGAGQDGMPIVVDEQLAAANLDPAAFRVIKSSGADGRVHCATLLPALGPLERRTILLVGDLGSAEDPPRRVEIPGPLALLDGGTLRGLASDEVVRLEEGPRLVVAERYDFSAVHSLVTAGAGQCPADATRQLVNVAWQGGVTGAEGAELGDRERRGLTVTVRDAAGGERRVTPFALGDLNDRDNYLHLCLDTNDEATRVDAEAGLFFDPAGDPNPETHVRVAPGLSLAP